MEYAISTWNFEDEDNSLSHVISTSVDMGCTAVSFTPAQLLSLEAAASARLHDQIVGLDLSVTVHADFTNTPSEIDRMMNLFDERLRCISMDPRCGIDPAGEFFDPKLMLPLLEHVRDRSERTGTQFGLEDFPIDARALDRNRESLAHVLECPRFGALIDLGHMHLRISDIPHFGEKGISGYLTGVPVPIFELHVHDNHADGDHHMPPGQGSLDFSAAAEALRDIGFDGVSTIEAAPRRYGAEPASEYDAVTSGLRLWKNELGR